MSLRNALKKSFVPGSKFSPDSEREEQEQLCEVGQLHRGRTDGHRTEPPAGKIGPALRSANRLQQEPLDY